jgi:hypothetical protein
MGRAVHDLNFDDTTQSHSISADLDGAQTIDLMAILNTAKSHGILMKGCSKAWSRTAFVECSTNVKVRPRTSLEGSEIWLETPYVQ